MRKLYIAIGLPLIVLGFVVVYYTALALEHNMSTLNIIGHFSSYLMIVSFIVAGLFLVITGVKNPSQVKKTVAD